MVFLDQFFSFFLIHVYNALSVHVTLRLLTQLLSCSDYFLQCYQISMHSTLALVFALLLDQYSHYSQIRVFTALRFVFRFMIMLLLQLEQCYDYSLIQHLHYFQIIIFVIVSLAIIILKDCYSCYSSIQINCYGTL